MKLADAVGHFGSKNRLAKALGLARSSVTGWGEDIPWLRQCELQVITGGELVADAQPSSPQEDTARSRSA